MRYCPKCAYIINGNSTTCDHCGYSEADITNQKNDDSQENKVSATNVIRDEINKKILLRKKQLCDEYGLTKELDGLLEEDFDILLKYSSIKEEKPKVFTNDRNEVSALLVAAMVVVLIMSFIAGLVLGNVYPVMGYYEDKFNWVLAFGVWICGGFNALLLYGFAEVIQLLGDIKNK